MLLECHRFGTVRVAMASGAAGLRRSIRNASLLLLLSFGAVHGNAMAASDVADAAMRGDTPRLLQLIAAKTDVNAAQPDGTTALHWAAYHSDTRAAAALLRAHANPGAVMENGMTPLTLACEAGNADLVQELLKGGADPNQTLPNGETPLMMA